jgi:hypothetical protein
MAQIIERAWRLEREVSAHAFASDMAHAHRERLCVYAWTGTDRASNPLTVAWVAGPHQGTVFSAYEITD